MNGADDFHELPLDKNGNAHKQNANKQINACDDESTSPRNESHCQNEAKNISSSSSSSASTTSCSLPLLLNDGEGGAIAKLSSALLDLCGWAKPNISPQHRTKARIDVILLCYIGAFLPGQFILFFEVIDNYLCTCFSSPVSRSLNLIVRENSN